MKKVDWRVFLLFFILVFVPGVFAVDVNVTGPLGGSIITAGISFNINWTSGDGDDHHKIGYTTTSSAACTGSGGSSGEVTGWTLLCHSSSCSSPRSTSLELNSSTVRVKVTGHTSGHSSLTVDCSDEFTVARISSAPTNLVHVIINSTSINLSWDSQLSTDLVTKYMVFRDSVNVANTTDNNTAYYLDTGLNSSYYNYTILAVNPIGNSIFSNELNISTSSLDTSPPASISSLVAYDIGDNYIFWNWTNPVDSDFNHTQIYRNSVFIENVNSSFSSYNMTGLVTNTPYSISVRTVDNSSNVNFTFVNLSATTSGSSGGESGGGGSGESVSVTSPNGGESWEPGSSNDITWTSSNVDHFEIYYSTNSGSSWILLEAHPYGTSSTTSYSWTVPSSTSSTMRVRVDGHDSSHVVQATDGSDSDFSIASSDSGDGSSSSSSGDGGGSDSNDTLSTEKEIVNWVKNYSEDDEDFSEKIFISKGLREEERVNIKVFGEAHYVGVVNLTETSVLIEVASVPQRVTLETLEEKKFDVNEDNYYDLLVRLNGIESGLANISILYINESIPSEKLFDIRFSLENSLVRVAYDLLALITIESFSKNLTFFNLSFSVIDENGLIVYFENDSIVVDGNISFEKAFSDLALDIGRYSLILTVLYDGFIEEEFRVDFEVVRDKNIVIWAIVILSGLILIGVAGLFILRFKRKFKS